MDNMGRIATLLIYSVVLLGSTFAVLPLVGWLKNATWNLGSWAVGADPLGFLPPIGTVEVWVILLVGVINACWIFVVFKTREGS